MTATRKMSTTDTAHDIVLDYRAYRMGAGWNVYTADPVPNPYVTFLTDALIADSANYLSSTSPMSSVFAQ
jgi:hypothetical protein